MYFYVALFLIRDPEFIETLPPELKNDFTESSEQAANKMKLLKSCIKGRFPVSYFQLDDICISSFFITVGLTLNDI